MVPRRFCAAVFLGDTWESHMTIPARTLQPEDLRWLVCPVCHQALALEAEAIRCAGCGRHYPIVDGIPVLLADRAS
jgi:uncharacterized protein YbaR (Trm112 family)